MCAVNSINPNFSIIIPVKNEEKNLALCLEAVKDFDDVVIVDSHSTDGTGEIAQKYNREVIQFDWDGHFPKKRNWALRNYRFKHDWVLFLDADERVTQDFTNEVCKVIKNTKHVAFWVLYSYWFLGRLLKHGDVPRKTALLKIGSGEYERVEEDHWSSLDMEVHEHMVVNGSVGVIRSKLEHYDKRELVAYYDRHNQYTSWEAHRFIVLKDKSVLSFRQRIKYRMLTWYIFPPCYFFVSYFLKLGFLDGRSGFYFNIGKLFKFYQIQAKIIECLQKKNK